MTELKATMLDTHSTPRVSKLLNVVPCPTASERGASPAFFARPPQRQCAVGQLAGSGVFVFAVLVYRLWGFAGLCLCNA